MCFLVLSYRQHARYRLVLATNRDEFYARPTAPAAYWDDVPALLAGRDVKGGGTWLGVTRAGRWAALTNVREPGPQIPDAPTRGALVADYLAGTMEPRAYLEVVRRRADRYNGFNLILGDARRVYYFGNRAPGIRLLKPGLYGLSNHLLDTPWPKVERGKAALADALDAAVVDPERLFAFLADTEQAPDEALPDTGIGPAWERLLSPIFIKSPTYGTRASTIVLVDYQGRVTFIERTNDAVADGEPFLTRRYDFVIKPGIVHPG
jgi:uncharacterized protein with NRDE domain